MSPCMRLTYSPKPRERQQTQPENEERQTSLSQNCLARRDTDMKEKKEKTGGRTRRAEDVVQRRSTSENRESTAKPTAETCRQKTQTCLQHQPENKKPERHERKNLSSSDTPYSTYTPPTTPSMVKISTRLMDRWRQRDTSHALRGRCTAVIRKSGTCRPRSG